MYYKIINNVLIEGPINLGHQLMNLSKEELLNLNYYEIIEAEIPVYNKNTQYITLERIIETDTVIHSYIINNLTNDEIAESIINRKRWMKQDATEKRYIVETSGLSINNIVIKTDRESQATIGCTLNYLGLVPNAVIDWKGTFGWTSINMASANFSAIAIGNHVQACFSHERVIHEAIDATTTHEDLDNIDINVGWPPNEITI